MNMFIRCILLIIFVLITVQGKISRSTINSDAIKLTQLYRKYTEHLPVQYAFEETRYLCSWMLDCCPYEVAHFFSLILEEKFSKKCIIASNKVVSTRPGCGENTYDEHDLEDYIRNNITNQENLNSKIGRPIKTWIMHTENICSTEILQTFICEKDSSENFQTCQEKVLQTIAWQYTDGYYQMFINQLEKDPIRYE